MKKKTEPFILFSLVITFLFTAEIPLCLLDHNLTIHITNITVVIIFSLMGIGMGTYRLSRHSDKYIGAGWLPFIFFFLFRAIMQVLSLKGI